MVKGTQVSIEFDLNKYSILAALLIDRKDFCGDGSHLWHFLRLTSPEMETALRELQARTDTRGGERVERTLALVTGERELYSRKRQFDELLRFGVTPALKKQRRAKAPIPRLKLRSAHRATQGKNCTPDYNILQVGPSLTCPRGRSPGHNSPAPHFQRNFRTNRASFL